MNQIYKIVIVLVFSFFWGCDIFNSPSKPNEQEMNLLVTRIDLEENGFRLIQESNLKESIYKQKWSDMDQVVYSLYSESLDTNSFSMFSEATRFDSWLSMKEQIYFNFLFSFLMDLIGGIEKQQVNEFDCNSIECKCEILLSKGEQVGVRMNYFFIDRIYSFQLNGQKPPELNVLQSLLSKRIELFKTYEFK
ncbi:MAG: hypothetical protein SFU98_12995 [Leptospiraceae bacterium]|nr:hypothetical protein [Leptospiraceae bacterium]